jgi:hypothetical protein
MFMAAPTAFASGNNVNLIIPLTNDRRFDLMFAACRQKETICGKGYIDDSMAAA